MRTRVFVALLGLALLATISRPGRSMREAVSPFVPDTTLKTSDSIPPSAPAIDSVTIWRGRGEIAVDGVTMRGAEDNEGQIDLYLSRAAGQPSPDDTGYRFHFVGGDLPNGLVMPAGIWGALHWGVGPAHVAIYWDDGRTWQQDAFSFRMYVTAVDRAGNESPPSNIVSIAHDGNLDKEYKRTASSFGKLYRETRVRGELAGRWVGSDSNGHVVTMLIQSDGSASLYAGGETIIGGLNLWATEAESQFNIDIWPHEATVSTGYRGLIDYNGDRLRLCLGRSGAPRPTRFATVPDGSASLYELTRNVEH